MLLLPSYSYYCPYFDNGSITLNHLQCKGFMLFGGDDAEGLNFVSAGGHGVMSVTGK